MIQPYLPSIETEGETSLLFFGGRFSHAVNKRPVPGEFRIQVQFGDCLEVIVVRSHVWSFGKWLSYQRETTVLCDRQYVDKKH